MTANISVQTSLGPPLPPSSSIDKPPENPVLLVVKASTPNLIFVPAGETLHFLSSFRISTQPEKYTRTFFSGAERVIGG